MVSVHLRLVAALRERIEGRAVVRDATTSGTEAVSLLLDVAGHRLELHLLLVAPAPLFWVESAKGRKPAGAEGFADWLRRRTAGSLVAGVGSGASGRVLRLEFEPPGPPARTIAPGVLILDPIPSACRLLVLDADGRVEQRYPPTVHASPAGRGAPGAAYAEPRGKPREPWEQAFAPEAGRAPSDATEDRLWVCTANPPLPPVFLSPIPGPGAPAFGALDAAREAGRLWVRTLREREGARQVAQTLRAERKHLTQLRRRLADELAESAQGALLRRQAEALLACGRRVPRGTPQVELDDPARPGEKLVVRLDPALGFSQNAARLFQRAARHERALPVRRRKLEQVDLLLERTAAWLAAASRPASSAGGRRRWPPGSARWTRGRPRSSASGSTRGARRRRARGAPATTRRAARTRGGSRCPAAGSSWSGDRTARTTRSRTGWRAPRTSGSTRAG
jgi:hypothetical protein